VASGRAVRRSLLAVVVLLVTAAAALAALDVTGRLPSGLVGEPRPTASATPTLDPPRTPAPAVLPAEPTATPTAPVALPTAALDGLLASPALGGAAGAAVVDVATGETVFDRDAGSPRIPASVAKLATMATALEVYPADHRFRTEVLAGTPGPTATVVLRGGGDAALTSRPAKRGSWPRPASLPELADLTVAALRTGSPAPTAVTVLVDDSLFAGPAVSPHWPAGYVASGVVAPVSALSVDEGRVRPDGPAREADPAIAAGRDFARLLAKRGLDVTARVRRGTAPAGAEVLAAVESPTLGELVQLTLQTSDNDLAEALLRLAALGDGRTGSFDAGTATVLDHLAGLGVPTDGMTLLDGSGLSRGSRVPPATLARLLALAVDGSHPELAPLLDGLPVAGFTGTLALRYGDPPSDEGAGLVRAKTGTLTGVSSLAGTTSVGDRPVVFVAMSDRVPAGATLRARDDLDRFAALLAGPGPAGRSSGAGG
jgi:D-alanyl-D-alanine carboxypeptidase/D-alanyl-D-alanine-endopeptidase (penicillin-binding protein 4)